jgi:hypothetical protein
LIHYRLDDGVTPCFAEMKNFFAEMHIARAFLIVIH